MNGEACVWGVVLVLVAELELGDVAHVGAGGPRRGFLHVVKGLGKEFCKVNSHEIFPSCCEVSGKYQLHAGGFTERELRARNYGSGAAHRLEVVS